MATSRLHAVTAKSLSLIVVCSALWLSACADDSPSTSQTLADKPIATQRQAICPTMNECDINGMCYMPGEVNPANMCEVCDPTQDTLAWSAVVCLDDGLSCTSEACVPATGCASTVDAGSCLVDGACTLAGAVNPDNSCEFCDPNQNTMAYAPRSSGASCDDGDVCTISDACNGAGACVGIPAVGGACSSLPNGTSCSSADQCDSGFCVDGVCCDTSCNSGCTSCIQANTDVADGTCSPVRAGEDPNSSCSAQSASSCGRDGECDGAGACRLYAEGTVCSDLGCLGADSLQSERTCDGSGTCRLGTLTSCAPFLCDNTASACKTTCTAESVAEDCVAGSVCDGFTCDNANNPPVADAGPSQNAVANQLVTLDGSGSMDPDGDSFSIEWVQLTQDGDGQPIVAINDRRGVRPSFIAPNVVDPVSLVFQLTIDDGEASSTSTTTVNVSRNAGNTAPVAMISAPSTARAGDFITVSGSESSDAEGSALPYRWSVTPTAAITGAIPPTASPSSPVPAPHTATPPPAPHVANHG